MTNRLVAAALVFALCSQAPADDASPAVRPPAPTPAPALQDAQSRQARPVAAALLREGSHLLHAQGEVRQDESRSEWRFHIEPRDANAPDYRLTLLPNAFLGELLQVSEASEGQVITFELTGHVYVFRGRNYLLVSHPPRVVGQRAANDGRRQQGGAQEAPSEPGADEANEDERDVPRSVRAEDLMRDLERAAGPIHRTSPAAAEPARPTTRAMQDHLHPEGTLLVQRRGRISRDAGGGWSFILESDVDGLFDPPMLLLPCLLLQRIEEHAQRSGSPTPVLISGQVTLFEGRNYLLPTLFLTPRERTPLTP